MGKGWQRKVWILGLALCLWLPGSAAGDPADFSQIGSDYQAAGERLQKLTQEQNQVLGQLFVLNRSLQVATEALTKAQTDVGKVEGDIVITEAKQASLAADTKVRQQQLGRRLRWLQENGHLSYLEIILRSTTLSDFIDRLEIVNALLAYDRDLLISLRDLSRQAADQKRLLEEQRTKLVTLQAEAEIRQAELQRAVAEKETALARLAGERSFYEGQLADLEAVWVKGAVPVLSQLSQQGGELISLNEFVPDDFNIRLLPPEGRILVRDTTLNAYLNGTNLKDLDFSFGPTVTKVTGNFAGISLELTGVIKLEGQAIIRFEPEALLFGGVPLPDSVLQTVWGEGGLQFDLTQLVSPLRVTEVKALEGAIEVKAGL